MNRKQPLKAATGALNEAALLCAGLEGLRGSVAAAGVASSAVSLLIVALFLIGLMVRAGAWIKNAVRRSSSAGDANDRRWAGRKPADDVPVPLGRGRSRGRGRVGPRF